MDSTKLTLANSNTPTTQNVQLPPDLTSKANVGTTINASSLSSSQNTTPTLPPASTPDTSFINSLQTGNPTAGIPSAPELKQNETDAQSKVDSTTQQIQDLLGQLGMKGADVSNLQTQQDIAGKSQALADLNTQYAQKQAQYKAQFQKIGEQNIPSLFSSGQLALAKAAANSELGSLAAQIQAAQGNLNTAYNTIDKTIEEKYKPIQENIDAQLKYYELNKDKLTIAQQKLATRQEAILNAQKTQVSNEQSKISQAQKDLQTQVTAGLIDQNTGFKLMGDLLNGTISIGDFYKGIGVSQTVNDSYGNSVVKSTMTLMGAVNDMTVAEALTNIGINKIVEGLVKQEGGTPQGTNNPGNIKFAGQPGATKGKAATDGGNFANFATPQDFNNAIKSMITKAANNGKNLSDFIASYKGVTKSTPDYKQYGLLADVPGFNPNDIQTKDAINYLNYYIKNGAYPTSYALFGKTTGKNLANVSQKAQDLYFKATGQALPDVSILKANKGLITANNKLENNLNIQEGTINQNFKLAIDNIDKNKINQSAQPINAFINNVKDILGNPEVAQYLAQNTTLRNEAGSLLALKNASGTTVADKLESAGLINKNASEEQQKAVLKILMQEAENARSVLKSTSAELYKQIDPLETDVNNPNRRDKTQTVDTKDYQTTPSGIKYKII